MPDHPNDRALRDKLETIVKLAEDALAEDVTGKPNLLRVALSQIEDVARVPNWPQ